MDTDPGIVDLTNLRQIADGDADFVRELTEIFLIGTVKLTSELRGARERHVARRNDGRVWRRCGAERERRGPSGPRRD